MAHDPILAADTNGTAFGAALGAIIAVGGYLWQTRASRDDSATTLLNGALALADRYRADDGDCRRRLDAVIERVDALAVELAKCNEKHARAEDAMREHGIVLPE